MPEGRIIQYSSDAVPCEGGFVWTSPAIGFGWRMALGLTGVGLITLFLFASAFWPSGTMWIGSMQVSHDGDRVYRRMMFCIGCFFVMLMASAIRGGFLPTTVAVVGNTLTHAHSGLLRRVVSSEVDLSTAVKATVTWDGDSRTSRVEVRDARGSTLVTISDIRDDEERLQLLADLLNEHLNRRNDRGGTSTSPATSVE